MAKKVTPISGYPEWTPGQRLVEQQVLDTVRRWFELFGFAPIETRAVEPLSVLLAKGETDKEIYVLRRLQADAEDGHGPEDPDDALGLHFDLTVPFARYVQENVGKLDFPFKRYQIQKVWRGERPQEGRYREFYQADIDVVARDNLPLHFDAEMPRLLQRVLAELPVPPVQIRINNRKVLEGLYRGLGLDDITTVLRIVDKVDKIGPDAVTELLTGAGLTDTQAHACVAVGTIKGAGSAIAAQVEALGVSHPLLSEGLDELLFVLEACADLPAGSVVADLSIARGLDYYTGTVYEGYVIGDEGMGAVCSGGRYDDLVGGDKLKLPGVGVSIGITRLLGVLFKRGALTPSRPTPTVVLVALDAEDQRPGAQAVAEALRERGIPAETYHLPQKYGKQIRYAERKGIPFVWFTNHGTEHQVRDIRSGEQLPADPDAWTPPAADLAARAVVTES